MYEAFADGPLWMREFFSTRILHFLKGEMTLLESTLDTYFDPAPVEVDLEEAITQYRELVD